MKFSGRKGAARIGKTVRGPARIGRNFFLIFCKADSFQNRLGRLYQTEYSTLVKLKR